MKRTDMELDEQSVITSRLVAKYNDLKETDYDEARRETLSLRLDSVLADALRGFEYSRPAGEIVEKLARDLHLLRREAGLGEWSHLIPRAQKHPVSKYLQQDPFTQWSFSKPRGYSGDASLMDIFYKHPASYPFVESATELGREIFAYTSEAESSKAGRERREILARTVDEAAAEVEGAEVLALACGHLRESELSAALKEGRLKRWVAMDQDPISVETVRTANAGTAVQPMEGNVAGLMRRAYDIGQFDLVYASGLYDYLPRPVAVRLTQRLLELVKPGGAFFFANFTDEITTDGYMETFMDWPLILRRDADMLDIMEAATKNVRCSCEPFYGTNRNIVYGKIRKFA